MSCHNEEVENVIDKILLRIGNDTHDSEPIEGGEMKTLNNSDVNGARKNVPDIEVFGDGDAFQLICKASSKSEGWMKSTKAMEIKGCGCVVQVTTQQKNPDNSYSIAEALCFVPNTRVVYIKDDNGTKIDRFLVDKNHEAFIED